MGSAKTLRFEASAVINQPLAEVFEFVTKFENVPRWVKPVVAARQTSAGALGVGTTGVEHVDLLGKRIQVPWEVTDFESNRQCTFKTASESLLAKISSEVCFSFKPVVGGTEVTSVQQTELTGLSKLAAPLIARISRRQRKVYLVTIKELLESRANAAEEGPA